MGNIENKKWITVSTTFKIQDVNLTAFENYLKYNENFDFIDLKVLADTEELYSNDKSFQRLVKKVKQAQRERDEYINKHNE